MEIKMKNLYQSDAPTFNLEDGIKEAIRRLEAVTDKPILASVYGYPHSGKSYLINKLSDYFDQKGDLQACRFTGSPRIESLERMDRPERRNLVYLFHCAWEYFKDHRLLPEEDPHILAEKVAKRVHLRIGMFNPNRFGSLEGDYDLLITNPESKIKVIR